MTTTSRSDAALGLTAGELVLRLRARGHAVSEPTLTAWLHEWVLRGVVVRVSPGRYALSWAWAPGLLHFDAPEGGALVALDAIGRPKRPRRKAGVA